MELLRKSLKDLTSLQIGGEVDMATITSIDELRDAVTYAKDTKRTIHILGGGTNSYFSQDLSAYLVIKNEIKGIEVKTQDNDDSTMITCGAGEVWDDVVSYAVERELWGIENLSYIPGTVGGAPVQNIGAYGQELSSSLVSVEVFDCSTMSVVTLTATDCHFGYRDSLFKKEKGRYCITRVTLTLSKNPQPVLSYSPLTSLRGTSPSIQKIRDEVIRIRTDKLPNYHQFPNAGSFFKNPVLVDKAAEIFKVQFPLCPVHEVEGGGIKIPAAWLIEHVAHAKGVKSGAVGTWPKQPLVIVNYDSANADDVNQLAQTITQTIFEKTGITLECEVNYIT